MASSIADIAQTDFKVDIRPYFPTVARVQANAVIRPQTAGRESKCRLRSREPNAVAQGECRHVVIERIGCGRSIWTRRTSRGNGLAVRIKQVGSRKNDWGEAEEIGIPAPLNVVIRGTESKQVRANGFAAIVLQLMVALGRGLRGEIVRARLERSNEKGQTGGGERLPCVSILNLILELQIFKTDAMGERPGVEVNSHDVGARIVFVAINLKA